ncbi:MAG: transposase [Methyloprofundus sp.]|nr:transposase [Methyloprofundus sp.]
MGNLLHHYSEEGAYQFVTFRTQDSIDPFLMKLSKNTNLSVSAKEMQIDEYSDSLDRGCYLKDEVLHIVMQHIKSLEPDFYDLIAVSVMPNHVHVLFEQREKLSVIMQKIKGVTAFKINKILLQKGHFWCKSYFDKAIRNERHFNLTYQYIKNNAIKAGLIDQSLRFYGIYK